LGNGWCPAGRRGHAASHTVVMPWPAADTVVSPRLLLDPLTVDAADEMVSVLSDPELYKYTGGQPPTLEQLREEYTTEVAGQSADDAQRWLNWVVRWRHSQEPVGYVQAMVEDLDGTRVAEIAWVISAAHQRQGVATEASNAMIEWLCSFGVQRVAAHILPNHDASAAVARRLGLHRTDRWVDGEIRWESTLQPRASTHHTP
jgi:RimJ/RimL family protein N-acetyltransferase